MKKSFFVYALGVVMALVGIGDIGKAASIEFSSSPSITEQRAESRATREGLLEVSAASIFTLLAQYLSKINPKNYKYHPLTFRRKTPFPLNKGNYTDLEISEVFNQHKTDFIFIVHYELGEKLAKAIRITNLGFKVVGNSLYYDVNATMLVFSNSKNQTALTNIFKKIFDKLVEVKIEHIQDKHVENFSNKSSGPEIIRGNNLLEVIKNCFLDEVLEADKEVRTIDIDEFTADADLKDLE